MNSRINQERLWQDLTQLGRIGRTDAGGITRFPFTKEDREAGVYIENRMKEAGLIVRTDAAGNLIGTWKGTDETLPCVISGSHYDTVKEGGAFDGTLGILSAIEAVRTLREQGFVPKRTLRVIGFKDEEGNRFGYGMVGSKAITGRIDAAGLDSRDEDGITLFDAMKAYGLAPEHLADCKMDDAGLFVELHIEQGNVLASAHTTIGVVSGIAGLRRYTVEITGISGHAGATPMGLRHDPVPAMCTWIETVTRLATEKEGCVATVGRIETFPGVCNVICERVRFTLDIRSLREADIADIMNRMSDFGNTLPAASGIEVHMEETLRLPSLSCSEKYRALLSHICEEAGISRMPLVSGAGHDCMNFKDHCETAMIFVPSKHGWSHRKEEFTSKSDCAAGAQVLCRFLEEVLSETETL